MRAVNGVGRVLPGAPCCPLPTFAEIFEADPGRLLTVKVKGATPSTVAVAVFTPTLGPICHNPADAIPCASLVAVPYWIAPPPAVTANVTTAPSTGVPPELVTRTARPGTAVATIAVAGGEVDGAIADA
jgi:hypothetical protein